MTPRPIGYHPDLPLTGGKVELFSALMNEDVAKALAAYRTILIDFPPHVEFHARCDFLMRYGRETRGMPQTGMRALGPSGSGKTTAAEAFVKRVEAARPRTAVFVPIVMISLDKATTTKRLMSAILDYFHDPYSEHGVEQTLTKRAYACFERFETELLVIDEVQHLSLSRHHNTDVTDSLKRLLDRGIVPMVFLGTEDAEGIFKSNVQLTSRLRPPCDFIPLSVRREHDRALFSGYVGSLDRAVVDKAIFARHAGLTDPWIRGCLHAVSDGIVGRVSRLIGVAIEIARRRRAECIEVFDLAIAVDRFAIPGLIDRNPFRETRPADGA